jgi:hypothetical protein
VLDELMKQSFSKMSFTGQFLVFSLVILIAGMSVIGLWVQREIEEAVTTRTAGVTALYVDSFIGPHLQEFGAGRQFSAEDVAELDRLLLETPLGSQVVSFKLWTADGTVLYSPNPTLVGQTFEPEGDLVDAFAGEVVSHISNLSAAENAYESQFWDSLIETYAPVRDERSGQIVAVSEFYQLPDALQADLRSARLRSWLIVGGATLVMYLVLVGLVRRASNLIGSQRRSCSVACARRRLAPLPLTNDTFIASRQTFTTDPPKMSRWRCCGWRLWQPHSPTVRTILAVTVPLLIWRPWRWLSTRLLPSCVRSPVTCDCPKSRNYPRLARHGG